MSVFTLLGAAALYFFLGCLILSATDRDGDILRWFDSCPPSVSWLLQPTALAAWPVVVSVWLLRRK